MNGNWKEARNGRGAGVLGAWISKEKGFQLGQSHNKLGDIVVVQREGALATAENPYAQSHQVPECLDLGGKGNIDSETGEVVYIQ